MEFNNSKNLNPFSLIVILLLLSSCIAKNNIEITLKKPTPTTAPLPAATISNIQIINHQVVITGTNLNTVSNFKIQEGATTTNLQIETQTATSLVANTISNVTFAAGRIFDFILSNASAAATFTINFSLCDSTLGGKGFNCTLTPNDKEVLSYDAASGLWKPRAVNGLSYQGAWDATTAQPVTATAGDYYIVSVANAPYAVGDWIVFNGTTYDHINNSTLITSVYGRTGAVVATKGDYVLTKMGDVDLTTTPPVANQVLKYNGTNWVPATVTTTESDPTVTAFAKAALPTCGAGQVLKGDGTNLSCVIAAVPFSGTANRAVLTDGTGALGVSAVTNTELGFLSGVTSNIQTQLNAKLGAETDPNVLAFAKTVLPTCLAGEVLKSNGVSFSCVTDNSGAAAYTGAINRVVLTDGATGALTTSSVTNTEIGYVSGVTSAIQTQLNAKQATISKATVQDVSKLRVYGANVTNYVEITAPVLGSNINFNLPSSNGTSGYVLQTDGAGNTSWIAVTSAAGNYAASQITNVPAGNIAATNVQAALNELDTKKQSTASLSADVQALVLSSYVLGTNAVVAATDSIVGAFGKLQKQISDMAVSTVGGDLSGNLPNPTVAKIQGTAVSSGVPVSGQFFNFNGTNWAGKNIVTTDLKSSVAGNLFPGTACSANQTLQYSVVTDAFSCVNIDSLDAAKITTGTIAAARLPASATYWSAATGGINYAGGNVGIGTASPSSLLTVADSNTVTSGSYSGSVISSTASPASASTADVWALSVVSSLQTNFNSTRNIGANIAGANNGTGVLATAIGTVGTAQNKSTGTITTATGLYGYASNLSTGTITNAEGGLFTISNSGGGTITNGYGVYIGNIAGTNHFSLYATDATSPSYFAGNVGIGTTAPTAPLHVVGGGTSYATAFLVDSSAAAGGSTITLGNNNTSGDQVRIGVNGYLRSQAGVFGVDTSAANAPLTLSVNSSEKMRVLSSGNVGIGTTVPVSVLNISGATSTAGAALGSTNPQQVIMGGNANNRLEFGMDFQNATAIGFIQSRNVTTGAAFLSLNPGGGNVGIGTTAPATKLHVDGGVLKLSNSGVNSATVELRGGVDGGNSSSMYIRNSAGNLNAVFGDGTYNSYINALAGNFGIGTTTPGAKLHVAGAGAWGTGIMISDSVTSNNAEIMAASNLIYFRSSATATAGALSSAGTWVNGSDRVLKKEIVDSKYGLDSVLKMRPVDYRMKSNNEKQVGFIAQEMKTLIPEVVSGKEGKMGISYGNLTAVLTKAIQQIYSEFKLLVIKVTGLEEKDAAKERAIASVKAENAQLKAKVERAEKENALIKTYLCKKDPKATICN